MKNKKVLLVIVMIVCASIFCLTYPQKIVRSMDYPVVNSYQKMIEQSHYVVYGHFTGFNYEWNMIRDENDNPSSTFTSIGKVHNFEVEKIYKGNIKDVSIKVNQCYNDTVYYDNIMPDTSEINEGTPKVIVKDELYIEPSFTKSYLLFLDYDESYKLYYAAVEPFMVIVENDTMQLNSNLIDGNIKTSTYSNGIKSVKVETEYPQLYNFSDELTYSEFKQLFGL